MRSRQPSICAKVEGLGNTTSSRVDERPGVFRELRQDSTYRVSILPAIPSVLYTISNIAPGRATCRYVSTCVAGRRLGHCMRGCTSLNDSLALKAAGVIALVAWQRPSLA